MLLSSLSTALSESTWAYPVIGALHVLGMAWFGGTVLFKNELIWQKRIGVALMLITGALLVLIEPSRCLHSISFWIKISLLLVALRRSSVILWIAIIFAARGIAYF